MIPDQPPISNQVFVAPKGLDETQVHPIKAFIGIIPPGNSLEGSRYVVVAWKPTEQEIREIFEGGLVYLSCLGTLTPHFLTTKFSEATYGAISNS
jgi:hypothetical protein